MLKGIKMKKTVVLLYEDPSGQIHTITTTEEELIDILNQKDAYEESCTPGLRDSENPHTTPMMFKPKNSRKSSAKGDDRCAGMADQIRACLLKHSEGVTRTGLIERFLKEGWPKAAIITSLGYLRYQAKQIKCINDKLVLVKSKL